ncbi:efflux pump, RND family, membrane fusion protein [Syntrophotalea carbinolica DSM 2380]|uniref:Efflux pump, RND family, membrane fusion protein n=1 Tax=Syntrophotalea carbinolica (strain DSM 2380 / NBRC 103641 / GraBd1) TaxID=338963 RepID=Q3A6D5_SYNC1|nr:efflux RND transporter periplasmic adaptor subunit [Syntrophotalea carbinolica]ABA88072.1 efflux pump, RND family, membrane fusion protein [Syntrophotalea carbinolica DSM 2380]
MNDISKNNSDSAETGFEALLTAHAGGGVLRRWRWALITAAIVLLLTGFFLFRGNGDSQGPQYLTEKVTEGKLVVKVTATGNLEPTNQVEVGSELSGTVDAVYVDDDDRVTKGQLLAKLDLSKFEDAVAHSRAAVEVAEAELQQALATFEETHAKLDRYREVSRLSGGKVPSKTEMEAAEADVARAKADQENARAGIAEAKANLRSDETDLAKAHIRSPIDGVVLERAVDPGQAVAASLQAVTLFTLAEDLSKMELEVDVDEADVGQVKAGLGASFSVDAWPDRNFEAVITRVGFNASDDDGVISYPAVLKVANDDLSLRPGMTATAVVTTLTHENALLVSNAALRFTPSEDTSAEKSGGSLVSSLIPHPPARTHKAQASAVAEDGSQCVWVLRDGQAAPVQVKTGASNGRVTEILDGELQVGMDVITETVSMQP